MDVKPTAQKQIINQPAKSKKSRQNIQINTSDTVCLGTTQQDKSPAYAHVVSGVKEPGADALRKEIDQIYDGIIKEEFDNPYQMWERLVEKSEELIKIPDGLKKPLPGALAANRADNDDVDLVAVHAPRPQIAGTMAANWNFFRWKENGKIKVQRISEDDPMMRQHGFTWQHKGKTRLTTAGIARIRTGAYPIVFTVFEKNNGKWEQLKGTFASRAKKVENRDVGISPDGAMIIDNTFDADGLLDYKMDHQHNEIYLVGKRPTQIKFKQGKYVMMAKTEEEIKQEQMDRKKAKLKEEWSRPVDKSGSVVVGDDSVNIGGVKLPIRVLK